MDSVTVELSKHEANKAYACIMYFAKDYEQQKHLYEITKCQDDYWKELNERAEFYKSLARKILNGGDNID